MGKSVVGIRFKKVGKIYYFDPLDYDLKQSILLLWKRYGE